MSARASRKGREALKLEDWLPLYHEICNDFGFDEGADLECARALSAIMDDRGGDVLSCPRLSKLPSSVVVCGCSESLESDLEFVGEGDLVVAADGATSTVLSAGLSPAIIVTDLDGRIDDQITANAQGSIVFVHAHGDNRDAIERYALMFNGPVVGTCQCAPVTGLFNFGGFTDGDRAACILSELGVARIRLAGFDFDSPSEKPGRSSEVKAMKLDWARRILAVLSRLGVVIEPVRV